LTAYLVVGCRGLLAMTLLVAVLSKVRSRAALAAFRSSIEAMELIPRRWVGAVVAATIAGELAVPALLVVPATVPAGFLGAGVLIGAFTGSILAALRRGARASCRCFGASSRPLGVTHLARNTWLLAGAAVGWAGSLQGPHGALEPAGVAVALTAAGAAVVLTVALDDLVSVFISQPATR
jgi:hypothetical protein